MDIIRMHLSDFDADATFSDSCYSIWGNIYIEIGNLCFPHNEWDDIVSSILDMWLAEIILFIKSKKNNCTLCFMDGPYSLVLTKLKDDKARVSCMVDQNTESAQAIVYSSEFVKNILSITGSFLETCYQKYPTFIKTETGTSILDAYIRLTEMMR